MAGKTNEWLLTDGEIDEAIGRVEGAGTRDEQRSTVRAQLRKLVEELHKNMSAGLCHIPAKLWCSIRKEAGLED